MLTQVIARGPAMKYFSFGDYCLNTLKSEIRLRDKALEIEPQVYGILELLITRHGGQLLAIQVKTNVTSKLTRIAAINL